MYTGYHSKPVVVKWQLQLAAAKALIELLWQPWATTS